jgi:hypothetical protein
MYLNKYYKETVKLSRKKWRQNGLPWFKGQSGLTISCSCPAVALITGLIHPCPGNHPYLNFVKSRHLFKLPGAGTA